MDENLIPLPPKDAVLPPRVDVSPDALLLDATGVEKAARKLGLHTVKSDRLLASHELGKALKKVGAIKIGRTILYAAATHSQEAIEQCDGIIDRTQDAELALTALAVKQKLIRGQADVGTKFIKSVELDGSDDFEKGNRLRAVEPGSAAGPLVIANQAVVNTR
jgi:hypothetical protein